MLISAAAAVSGVCATWTLSLLKLVVSYPCYHGRSLCLFYKSYEALPTILFVPLRCPVICDLPAYRLFAIGGDCSAAMNVHAAVLSALHIRMRIL